MSTVQTHVELKGIQTRLERARAEYTEAERDRAMAETKAKEAKAKVTALEDELKRFQESHDKGIVVSEHALLRYIERVMGLDIEEIRQKILTPDVVHAIHHFRGGVIPGDGFKLRVRNNVVTTLMVDGDDE